jgi:hypothetical protein
MNKMSRAKVLADLRDFDNQCVAETYYVLAIVSGTVISMSGLVVFCLAVLAR